MTANAATNEYAAKQLAAAAVRLLTPDEFKTTPKIYFHQHNGAKFHVDLGKSRTQTVMFANYRLVTDDKRVQEQLDLVADQPGTFIYTLPNNEAAHYIEQELQRELQQSVMQTAAARSGERGEMFDPNAPIVPVQTQAQTMHSMTQTYLAPGTGMQSSIGPANLGDTISGQQTTPAMQTKPPGSSGDALAKLNAMTEKAKGEATASKPTVDFSAVLAEQKKEVPATS